MAMETSTFLTQTPGEPTPGAESGLRVLRGPALQAQGLILPSRATTHPWAIPASAVGPPGLLQTWSVPLLPAASPAPLGNGEKP